MPMYLFLLAVLFLSSCVAIPTQSERAAHTKKLASNHRWVAQEIKTDDFLLQTYVPEKLQSAKELTVYIEGDGLAWINTSTPSFNPTPINALALSLALRDDKPAVYLARPCQYVNFEQSENCNQKYWTSHRFAPEVIHATNQAIEQLKLKFKAEKLILVGYSGGGAVATIVSALRNDVSYLITIAGNLDHKTWTQKHQISPLTSSLNPVSFSDKLQSIQQTHYVGGKDRIVPEAVARAYAAKFTNQVSNSIVVIPEFDHVCCWEKYWPTLKNSKIYHDEK